VPPNRTPAVADFMPCTSGDQCRNGLCDTGLCAPLCRPELDLTEECPGLTNFLCARAAGPAGEPRHNQCQLVCRIDADCPADQRCVWRDVFEGGDDHHFVCATPAPERTALGQPCSSNTPAGDDECGSGLCLGSPPTCTRPCDNDTSDCSDVGPTYACMAFLLHYGNQEFTAQLCVRP
jgi:hypothetical protein